MPTDPTMFERIRYVLAISIIGQAYRVMPSRYYDDLDRDEVRQMAEEKGLEVRER